MKQRINVIAGTVKQINENTDDIKELKTQKATWDYVYNLEVDLVRTDRTLINRIIALEKKSECECVKAHGMPEADIVCNSHKQANEQADGYRERCDVEKAFEDYRKLYANPIQIKAFGPEHMKYFAVYFAERVKGGKL